MVRDWTRDLHPPHHQYLERFVSDGFDDGRFQEAPDMHRRQPPMQIDEALRQHCSISARRYFLAVIMDDGSPMTFSGPGPAKLDNDVARQFFDVEKYRRVMERLDTGASPVVDESFGFDNSLYKQPMEYPRPRMPERRRVSTFEDWGSPARQGRKRPRARHPVNDDDDVPMTVSTTRKGIKIGSTQDVWNFYEQRFKNCQQTACKLIAKAWVKAVEPKKQSTHPYTGKEEKAPDWWPKPWGTTKEDKVRHKEPDHLYKRERVHLLNHILRMIVDPNEKQHHDIRKLNLNVKKLEEITTEALSGFFTDKENPANARKRPYLNEIFKVAKQEERYKNGEIDGTTEVYVMAEDKMPDSFPETEDGISAKEEDEQDNSPTKLNTVHTMMPTPTSEQGPSALQGTPFLGDLPVRGTQYAPPIIHDISTDQHAFVESNAISVSGHSSVHPNSGSLIDIGVATPHDTSRRSSLFNQPVDYSGQNSTHMYTQQWQPGSTSSATPSMYAFTPQQTKPSATTFVNASVPMTQSQSYMNTSFDGLPRAYDPNQAPLFRSGTVQQATVQTPQAYNYLAQDNRSLPGLKVDPVPRSQLQ